jgi:hypothetical protein
MTPMRPIHGLLFAFSLSAVTAVTTPAWADVTITQTTSVKIMRADISGDSVTRIKGHKMRTDLTTKSGDQTSTIFDLDAQKMISIDHKKKEASVIDMAEAREAMSKVADTDVKADLKATGATKQVAGHTCAVYDSNVNVAAKIADQPMNVVVAGPVCLSKDAPGRADFAAFYLAAAEKGLFFQDPRQVKAQPGQAKGMVSLYKAMGEAGIPLSTDVNIKFEGSGPMAAIMGKMGGGAMQGETTKIETGALADDIFQAPAGYTVKTK